MNIQKLKSIVKTLETDANRIGDSTIANADLLLMFGRELDSWLYDQVKGLGGEASVFEDCNVISLEMALVNVLHSEEPETESWRLMDGVINFY